MRERSRARLRLLAQVVASIAVIALLVRDAELDEVLAALESSDMRWVVAAILVKACGITLHEIRLWVALLPWARLPAMPVIGIGYVSGLLNMVLPVRAGDLIAVGLLNREHKVGAGAAAAAVGITGFLEAAVFALFLLGVVIAGAARWEDLIGAVRTRQAMGTLTAVTLASIFAVIAVVWLGRRLRAPDEASRAGPLHLLRDTIVQAGAGLSAWGPMSMNVGLATVQVAAVVASFWLILPALGLQDMTLSLLAVCGVIAMGSLTAIVLPPSLGAGPAAASVLVLGFFGVSEAQALAYFALNWVVNTAPPVGLGLVPFVRRIGRLGSLLRGQDAGPPS